MGQKKLTSNGSANRMSLRDIPTGEHYAAIVAKLESEKSRLEREVKRLRREVGILTKRNKKRVCEESSGREESVKEEEKEGKRGGLPTPECIPVPEIVLRPEAKEFKPQIAPPPLPLSPSLPSLLSSSPSPLPLSISEPESAPLARPPIVTIEPISESDKMDIDTPQANTTEGGKKEFFSNLPELWDEARKVRDRKKTGGSKVFDSVGKFMDGPKRLGSLRAEGKDRVVWLYDNKRKYGVSKDDCVGLREVVAKEMREKDKVMISVRHGAILNRTRPGPR